MIITPRSDGDGLHLRLAGPWGRGDGDTLRLALDGLSKEPVPLRVDLAGLDSLPLAAVQVLWGYIRFARGLRRAVTVNLGPAQAETAQLLGLLNGGWEEYFHVG